MIKNMPKEILYYCVIPVVVIVFIDLLLLLLMRKKEDNRFGFGNLIRISLILIIAIVLPLIIGYDIWTINYFLEKQILFKHVGYVALIVFLAVFLVILIIWTFLKSLRNLKLIENEV